MPDPWLMESQSRVRIQQNICIPANCILKRAMIITLIYTSFLPFLNPDIPRGYQFYADLIFSNIYIAQDLQFYYRAFHDELQFAVSSDTIWQNRDHQYAVAIVDKDLNLSWTLRDSDPLRMEFIETVINTIHASMFKMPPILAEGEYMEFMNERNILDLRSPMLRRSCSSRD